MRFQNVDRFDLMTYMVKPMFQRRLDPGRTIKVRKFQGPSDHPMTKRKIILFSYKSAGASKFAEMFNQDSRALVWYEILDPFYTAYFAQHPENFPSESRLVATEGKRRFVYCVMINDALFRN